MNHYWRRLRIWIVSAASLLTLPASAQALTFNVTLGDQVAKAPVSGRLLVLLSKQNREPRSGPNWFSPEPFFGIDAKNLSPGDSLKVTATADGFPEPLDKLPAGKYYVQAVLAHADAQQHSRGAGNFYSQTRQLDLEGSSVEVVSLLLDKVIEETPFPESAWFKEVAVRSELLSRFHGREIIERIAVTLPAGYDADPGRRYPVIYIVPGFGGRPADAAARTLAAPQAGEGEVDFIRVLLNGNCAWGHHVYADSLTNGPRGRALVEELIPAIDARFRTIPQATARFVNGHSSGGWSSLWLQITHPDVFGGVWSTAPDPVDFRDYQQIDLYANPPLNMYVDPQGTRRPIARRGGKPVLWYDSFARMDDVLGRGGQLRSFEAVFSPLGTDGQPLKLWNRASGQIDPAVAEAWKKYDIRLKLQREWPELGPKLAGKLHVYTGALDTFYLNGAVAKLGDSLTALGSDAEVHIVPDKDHGNLMTPELVRSIRQQMSAKFRAKHGDPK